MADRLQGQCSASVVIVEQPASRILRFRYQSDARGRSAGSIPGVNSTPENKTFPAIKICGYEGPVKIVVSCVTKDKPYRPHSHNLVGRECKKGIFLKDMNITKDANICQFRNLGIQCVKKADIPKALSIRQELNVDPFKTKFDHIQNPQSIDLNAVRLAFQVLIPNKNSNIWYHLSPVCSDVIYDKMNLRIMKTSHCTGTVRGGTEIILLCDKVTPEDTAVVFYEEEHGRVVWEQTAINVNFHKQVAIIFTTPPYRNQLVSEPVNVFFQLKRLSDNNRSTPASFEYIPDKQVYLRSVQQKKLMPCLEYPPVDRPERNPIRRMSSLDYETPPQLDQKRRVLIEPTMDLPIPGTSRSDIHWTNLDARYHKVYQMDQVSPQLEALSISMEGQAPLGLATDNMVPNLDYKAQNMTQVAPNLVPVPEHVDQIMSDLVYEYASTNTNLVTPSTSTVGEVTQDYSYIHKMSSNTNQVPNSAHTPPSLDQVIRESQCTSNVSHRTLNLVHMPQNMNHEIPDSGHFSYNLPQHNTNQMPMPMDGQNTIPQCNPVESEDCAQVQVVDSGAMSTSSLSSIPLGDYNSDSDNLNKISKSDLFQP